MFLDFVEVWQTLPIDVLTQVDGESIESDVLCQSGDLICWGEWNFDPASEARFHRTIV
ncbi:MAG: hypothetical protein LH474_03835 [Chamaesiphon sp.]|nr:hypothetical protein [Chamaesiphon sp.]